LAVEVADQAWADCQKLDRNHLTKPIADQLYRATCSIGANFNDGYGRDSGKDRVRMWEYSLCSARESLFWYERSRHALDPERARRQIDLLNQICRLLLTMIPRERGRLMSARKR
jgi:four helix bundle protein